MKLVIANVDPIYLSVAAVVTSSGIKHRQSDLQQQDPDHLESSSLPAQDYCLDYHYAELCQSASYLASSEPGFPFAGSAAHWYLSCLSDHW